MTDFDAGGMFADRNFNTGRPSNCFMTVQFKSGAWERVYPKKKGTFDCKSSNNIAIKANLISG